MRSFLIKVELISKVTPSRVAGNFVAAQGATRRSEPKLPRRGTTKRCDEIAATLRDMTNSHETRRRSSLEYSRTPLSSLLDFVEIDPYRGWGYF